MARALALALLLACSFTSTLAYIGRKDWRKVDMEKAAKDLEAGDLPELLKSEDDIQMEDYDKRRSKGIRPPDDDVQLKDADEWIKHSQSASGPVMMFASLNEFQPDGKEWDKRSVEMLSAKWSDMIKTASLDAKFYDITTVDEKKDESAPHKPMEARILASLPNGWRGYTLRDFLLRQPELKDIEWDNVKLTPSDLDDEGNFKGGGHAPKVPEYMKTLLSPEVIAETEAKNAKGKKGKKKAKAPTRPKAQVLEEEADDVDDWPTEKKKEL